VTRSRFAALTKKLREDAVGVERESQSDATMARMFHIPLFVTIP